MRTRSGDLADELKQVIRLAGRDPEALDGTLPTLSALHRVVAAGELDEPARVHFILQRLIPEYLDRLPAGRDCRAIRELMTWEDDDGESQSLTTRYHKAAAHLVNAANDFGRRQEPRLLAECARRLIALDHEDRLAGTAAPAGAPAALPSPGTPPRCGTASSSSWPECSQAAPDFILKSRAYRYIAAGREDWLFPERQVSEADWTTYGDGYLLMPDPRPLVHGSEYTVGYGDGSTSSLDSQRSDAQVIPISGAKAAAARE